MSVAIRQALLYSRRRVQKVATTDGAQAVQQQGWEHFYHFWAFAVAQDEMQTVLESAIPVPYVPQEEPSVTEIEETRLYNIEYVGVHYSNEPLGGEHPLSEHSGRFY